MVKLVGHMAEVSLKLTSGSLSQIAGNYAFDIQKSSENMFLTFPDHSHFALLSLHTTKVLERIFGLPAVRLEALVDISSLHETVGRAVKESAATLPVNINVYGSNEAWREVGSHLSDGKIYLQRPDQRRPGPVYSNPHFMEFPGIDISSFNVKSEKEHDTISRRNNAEHLQEAISSVYADLKRSTNLRCVMGDARLRTPLLT